MMDGWLLIMTEKITATVDMKNGLITKPAPIFKWAAGLSFYEFQRKLSQRGQPMWGVKVYEEKR